MADLNTTKFSFSWNGIAARGFADGDAVTAEYDNDEATAYSGTKGEGALVIGKDGRGKITVRLQGTSATVPLYLALDKSLKNGEIAQAPPFIYKKIVGGVTYVYTGNCLLSKQPPLTSNKDMPEIELVFITANMTEVVV